MSNLIFEDIIKKPRIVNNVHESTYRCYSVLESVLEMVERGDSQETILEVANFLSNTNFIKPKETK